MLNVSVRLVGALSIIAALSTPALADEAWDTPDGPVTYLADQDGTAILSFTGHTNEVRFYFPGLAGNYSDRSVHDGYWVEATGVQSAYSFSGNPGNVDSCGITMTGPDGFSSDRWGTAKIVFHESGFPSNWTLLGGLCTAPLSETLQGYARTND
ncbi:MAG: hypothetical protein AAF318_01735 [Pseudomonadota bacterium]